MYLTPTTQDRDTAVRWFSQFEGAGLDGVVAKPLSGTYQPDKRVMFKIKHERTADCVVAGYRVHKSGPDAIGSLLPILAFMLPFSIRMSTVTSLFFALVGLFAVGYYAGTLSERSAVGKGVEIVLYGCGVFAISYLVGHFIPPLFGHAPVAVGG